MNFFLIVPLFRLLEIHPFSTTLDMSSGGMGGTKKAISVSHLKMKSVFIYISLLLSSKGVIRMKKHARAEVGLTVIGSNKV